MNRLVVRQVSPKRLTAVIDCRLPIGLFLTKERRKWVAVDNSTGDAWTEEFSRKHQAVRWLWGKFEVGDKARQQVRIKDAGELIAAARKQGMELDTGEADMILGYLEGHDYCLMVNDEGATVRHDEQYGDSHRGDEPYTVQEAIEFCQEMNDDLLRDERSRDKADEERLLQLRADEQALASLMERSACHVAGGRMAMK